MRPYLYNQGMSGLPDEITVDRDAERVRFAFARGARKWPTWWAWASGGGALALLIASVVVVFATEGDGQTGKLIFALVSMTLATAAAFVHQLSWTVWHPRLVIEVNATAVVWMLRGFGWVRRKRVPFGRRPRLTLGAALRPYEDVDPAALDEHDRAAISDWQAVALTYPGRRSEKTFDLVAGPSQTVIPFAQALVDAAVSFGHDLPVEVVENPWVDESTGEYRSALEMQPPGSHATVTAGADGVRIEMDAAAKKGRNLETAVLGLLIIALAGAAACVALDFWRGHAIAGLVIVSLLLGWVGYLVWGRRRPKAAIAVTPQELLVEEPMSFHRMRVRVFDADEIRRVEATHVTPWINGTPYWTLEVQVGSRRHRLLRRDAMDDLHWLAAVVNDALRLRRR